MNLEKLIEVAKAEGTAVSLKVMNMADTEAERSAALLSVAKQVLFHLECILAHGVRVEQMQHMTIGARDEDDEDDGQGGEEEALALGRSLLSLCGDRKCEHAAKDHRAAFGCLIKGCRCKRFVPSSSVEKGAIPARPFLRPEKTS